MPAAAAEHVRPGAVLRLDAQHVEQVGRQPLSPRPPSPKSEGWLKRSVSLRLDAWPGRSGGAARCGLRAGLLVRRAEPVHLDGKQRARCRSRRARRSRTPGDDVARRRGRRTPRRPPRPRCRGRARTSSGRGRRRRSGSSVTWACARGAPTADQDARTPPSGVAGSSLDLKGASGGHRPAAGTAPASA